MAARCGKDQVGEVPSRFKSLFDESLSDFEFTMSTNHPQRIR